MFNVLDISKYVISKHHSSGHLITNLKLQKILYYIQGYSFKFCNEPAFSSPIHKWPYGPVIPLAYYEYNRFRAKAIGDVDPLEYEAVEKHIKSNLGLKKVIDDVLEVTFDLSATELVEKTHLETPWQTAKDSDVITQSSIAIYFKKNNPLGIERTK